MSDSDKSGFGGCFSRFDTIYPFLDLPKSPSPPQTAPKPSREETVTFQFKAIKHLAPSDLGLNIKHIYNCIGVKTSKLLMSESKLTTEQVTEYSKRHDVLFVVEQELGGGVRDCDSYTHRYSVIIKCLRMDSVSGKLMYECQYVEELKRDAISLRSYRSRIMTFLRKGPITNTSDVIEVLGITPYSELAAEFRVLCARVDEVEKSLPKETTPKETTPKETTPKETTPKETTPKKVLYKNTRTISHEDTLVEQQTKIFVHLNAGEYKYIFTRRIVSELVPKVPIVSLSFESDELLTDDVACKRFRNMLEELKKPKQVDYSKSAFASLDNDD